MSPDAPKAAFDYAPETSLFRIPAELRLEIYELCIVHTDITLQLTSLNGKSRYQEKPTPSSQPATLHPRSEYDMPLRTFCTAVPKSHSFEPALCRTSRRIRAESLPIWYGSNNFDITKGRDVKCSGEAWFELLGSERCRLLKAVVVARWCRYAVNYASPGCWTTGTYGRLLALVEAAEARAERCGYPVERGVLRVELWRVYYSRAEEMEEVFDGSGLAVRMDGRAWGEYVAEKRRWWEDGVPKTLREAEGLMSEQQKCGSRVTTVS